MRQHWSGYINYLPSEYVPLHQPAATLHSFWWSAGDSAQFLELDLFILHYMYINSFFEIHLHILMDKFSNSRCDFLPHLHFLSATHLLNYFLSTATTFFLNCHYIFLSTATHTFSQPLTYFHNHAHIPDNHPILYPLQSPEFSAWPSSLITWGSYCTRLVLIA